MLTSLAAILFDADGVFQRPPPDLADQLARALGVPSARADAFILELFEAEADALTGEKDILACVEPVLVRWGVRDGLEAFERLWRQIEIDSTALGLVGELRAAGLYCAVASNQQARRAEAMSVGLGFRQIFDAEFYSCHLGLKKPSEAYFQEVARRCGLPAGRILFIDDRAANIEAARKVGFRTIHFAPKTLEGGGGALSALIAPHLGGAPLRR